MGALQRLRNSIQTLIIFWPVYPIHANSLFLVILWWATILSFSSFKYFHSWQRLSNLVDLSFWCISFSNKRKTTILFPSLLTFLQWAILPSKMVKETGTEFIVLWRQFVCSGLLRRNSEVKKISSDSESNSFTNLSRISDEDIMEEDLEDVKESLAHKLTSRVDVTWSFDHRIQMSLLKVKYLNFARS